MNPVRQIHFCHKGTKAQRSLKYTCRLGVFAAVFLFAGCSSEKNTEEKKVVVTKVQDVAKIVSEQIADLMDDGKDVLVLHRDTLLAFSFF